jgi:hypothetical protein
MMDFKPSHLLVLGGAVVAIGAWRVAAALKDGFASGKLNPASADNIVYEAASTPFDGSLGVWLWEKLNPEQVKAASSAATNARAAALASAKKRAQITPSSQTAADLARKPRVIPAAAEQVKVSANPASPDNPVYQAVSKPVGGSLGVWLWEKLNPEQARPALPTGKP